MADGGVLETVTFVPGTGVLNRAIHAEVDLAAFAESPTTKTILGFLDELVVAVQGKAVDDESVVGSASAMRVIVAMKRLRELVDAVPPIEQPMRFGNRAFRTWHARLSHEAHVLVDYIVDGPETDGEGEEEDVDTFSSLSLRLEAASAAFEAGKVPGAHRKGDQTGAEGEEVSDAARHELAEYLSDCFGNASRIDYGTGHECCFLFFLCALRQAGVVTKEDSAFLGTKVFDAYIQTVRKVQRTYFLEPAGSHGVWSLDDYQMLVFLLGAAQLVGKEGELSPANARDRETREIAGPRWMFFSAISFVHTVKTGAPFSEHSPLLYDLTKLPNWAQVQRSLRASFVREVLGKIPVAQHFLFGSLLPATWKPTPISSDRRSGRHVVPSDTGDRSSAAKASAAIATAAPWAATAAPWASSSGSSSSEHPHAPSSHHPMDSDAPWATTSLPPSHSVGEGVAEGVNEAAPWAPEAHAHHSHHSHHHVQRPHSRPRLPTPADLPEVVRASPGERGRIAAAISTLTEDESSEVADEDADATLHTPKV